MAFKLAIASIVLVPMVFSLNDNGKTRKFDFKLTCERLTEEQWQERIKGEDGLASNERIRTVMLDITTGWSGQDMVLDEDDKPAAFCREALECMFDAPGVIDVALRSYMKEVAAKVKN